MKRLFVLMSCALLLTACASRQPAAPWVAPAKSAPAPLLTDADGYAIEAVPFRAGVSSVTVEKLALSQGCSGGQGAGLMTPQGPVEVYRMLCDNGQVFMAKCELRQCRPVAPMAGAVAAPTATATTTATATASASASTIRVGVPRGLTANQVPALAISWRCGDCVRNDAFAASLQQAYAAQAARNGMTVSDAETATVSIVTYTKRTFPMSNTLATETVYGQQTLKASDATTAFTGVAVLANGSAKRIFEQLRATAG